MCQFKWGGIMNISINRKSGVPIYIQVKNQIMNEIKSGSLKIGTKMPTERELAQKLSTSRNTISAAYNQLEQEGILISYQGRGTFVAEESKPWKQHDVRGKINKLIDLGLEEALEMGLDTKEFLELVQDRIREKEEFLRKISAIFVECNIEQARAFANELSETTNLNVMPMVVADIEKRDEKSEKLLNEAQLIIATFNHVNEVTRLTSGLKKEVLGVAINPCLETIVKIARYPRGTKFGLVCLSKEFHFKVENALKSAGLDNIVIEATTSRDKEEVEEVVRNSHVLIVSPGRRDEVIKISRGEKEVISFDYNLDQGSVKAIISKIIETKNHN